MPTEPSNPRLQRMPLNRRVGSLLLLSKAMAYILSEDRPMNSYEEWQSCPRGIRAIVRIKCNTR